MSALRNYQIGLDTTNGIFVDDDGKAISAKKLRLFLGDTIRFTLSCVEQDYGDGSFSTYSIPAGTTLTAGIKERFEQSATEPFLALTESWTITDGSAGAAYFEINLSTSNLDDFLQDYEYREAWLEIELTATGGEILTTLAEPVDVRWSSIGDAPANPTVTPGYYTKTESDARYIQDSTGTTLGDLLVYDGSDFVRLPVGSDGQFLKADSTDPEGVTWDTIAGGGDVSAASNIADNAIVKGDGGAKGVQASGITCDDSNNLTGVAGLTASGTIDAGAVDLGSLFLDDGVFSGADLMINPAGTKRFYIYDAAVTHNPMNQDWDFILDGDTQNSVLHMDASADKVGILNSTPSEALDVTGNIGVSGTVDGRDVATDGSKLDGIEAGAEVNPTDAEIETAYNNQVAVMSEAEAHDGTSNDVRRLTAHLVRHNVDSSQAALTAITLTIDGAGSAITAGALGKFPTVPYSGEIESVEVAADQSGSIVIDIWKAADAIPTNANSITGSSPATLSSAQRSQDETLTGWTTSIAAGDVLGFEVDSASTVTEVTLTIKVKKGN
jgi:hypothetical protein